MAVIDAVLGRRLATKEKQKEKIGVLAGVPVLGLDALASAAYGPEAALAILLPLGAAGLIYMPWIVLAIIVLMTAVYFSYRQTIAAYPNGGGAYVVAKQNLGTRAGLVAAASLMLDYTLNVAVAISAGIAALVSAAPALQPYILPLCLLTLLIITVVNLRGVRESGFIFAIPTYLFVFALFGVIAFGVVKFVVTGGHPQPVVPPPQVPAATMTASAWILLRSFASGCTAMTGVEAVSNGVPLFGSPSVKRAQGTLTLIVSILGVLLAGIAYLSAIYHVGAMDQEKPGYQSIISQVTGAIAGRGVFYYVTIGSVLAVLALSANTSFAGFPRLCRLVAEDEFLPAVFANLGRRLVYSLGISILAVLAAVILIGFGGITDKLIPLFAVGAFSAFTLSQTGMVVHWRRSRIRKHRRIKITANALGALGTAVALVIIIVTKFTQGAWVTLVLVPAALIVFRGVNRHYRRVSREVERPIELQVWQRRPLTAVVPIDGWNVVAERGIRFALRLTDDVIALHITSKSDDKRLRKKWQACVEQPLKKIGAKAFPCLEIVHSPFRQIHQPILDYVNELKENRPDNLIVIVIPELVQPRWWEYLLHNHRATGLKALLYMSGDDRTIVVNRPWYLSDE